MRIVKTINNDGSSGNNNTMNALLNAQKATGTAGVAVDGGGLSTIKSKETIKEIAIERLKMRRNNNNK